MADEHHDAPSASELRLRVLSRWNNEGGAGPRGPQKHSLHVGLSRAPPLSNAELVQLQVRVIALENLMIMMLAEGSDRQLELAREMAACISPRPSFTHHPLTVEAAAHMINLVDRAIHYRNVDPVMNVAAPTSSMLETECCRPSSLKRSGN